MWVASKFWQGCELYNFSPNTWNIFAKLIKTSGEKEKQNWNKEIWKNKWQRQSCFTEKVISCELVRK